MRTRRVAQAYTVRPSLRLPVHYGVLEVPWADVLHLKFSRATGRLEVHTVDGRVLRTERLN